MAEEKFVDLIKDIVTKIEVIGNSKKEKLFFSKISFRTNIRIESLSIKYPQLEEFKDIKIVLLNSAILETPVLKNKKGFVEEAHYKKGNGEPKKKIKINFQSKNSQNEIKDGDKNKNEQKRDI